MSELGASRRTGVAMLITASALWSLSGLFVKVVQIEPVPFAFWRALAAGVAVAPLILLSRSPVTRSGWMALSVVVYTAVVTLLITAMTYSTAAAGILLQYTGPVFCALLAWMLQGRHIGGRTWLAIAIASAGIAIMILGGEHPRGWVGPVCGLLSGVAFGGLILILEHLDRITGKRANPFAIVAINNLGCAILLIPLSLLLATPLATTPAKLSLVALCGVVQLGLPYILFQLSLRRVTAVDASLLILLEPVLNPIWVSFATAERPDGPTILGGAAILAAMVLEATHPSVR